MKEGICFLLYKKYIICELTNRDFKACQPVFDDWYNYCFFKKNE